MVIVPLTFMAAMLMVMIWAIGSVVTVRTGDEPAADNPMYCPHHPRRRKDGIGPAIDDYDARQ